MVKFRCPNQSINQSTEDAQLSPINQSIEPDQRIFPFKEKVQQDFCDESAIKARLFKDSEEISDATKKAEKNSSQIVLGTGWDDRIHQRFRFQRRSPLFHLQLLLHLRWESLLLLLLRGWRSRGLHLFRFLLRLQLRKLAEYWVEVWAGGTAGCIGRSSGGGRFRRLGSLAALWLRDRWRRGRGCRGKCFGMVRLKNKTQINHRTLEHSVVRAQKSKNFTTKRHKKTSYKK